MLFITSNSGVENRERALEIWNTTQMPLLGKKKTRHKSVLSYNSSILHDHVDQPGFESIHLDPHQWWLARLFFFFHLYLASLRNLGSWPGIVLSPEKWVPSASLWEDHLAPCWRWRALQPLAIHPPPPKKREEFNKIRPVYHLYYL